MWLLWEHVLWVDKAVQLINEKQFRSWMSTQHPGGSILNLRLRHHIGVGRVGAQGHVPPNNLTWGAQVCLCPLNNLVKFTYIALFVQNGAQIAWFKSMFCWKTDSFRGLRPLDPHINTFACRRRATQCAPRILPIFLRLCHHPCYVRAGTSLIIGLVDPPAFGLVGTHRLVSPMAW